MSNIPNKKKTRERKKTTSRPKLMTISYFYCHKKKFKENKTKTTLIVKCSAV
jgi:hypothetical protein